MKNLNRTTNHAPRTTQNNPFKRLTLILTWCLVLAAWSVNAYAANYDIKQMTPEVREALAGRQARYSQLQMAKRSGAIAENNEGLVSGNSPLVSEENHDRLVIYQTIANQNGLGSSGLSQIKRAFAETIREREGRG